MTPAALTRMPGGVDRHWDAFEYSKGRPGWAEALARSTGEEVPGRYRSRDLIPDAYACGPGSCRWGPTVGLVRLGPLG